MESTMSSAEGGNQGKGIVEKSLKMSTKKKPKAMMMTSDGSKSSSMLDCIPLEHQTFVPTKGKTKTGKNLKMMNKGKKDQDGKGYRRHRRLRKSSVDLIFAEDDPVRRLADMHMWEDIGIEEMGTMMKTKKKSDYDEKMETKMSKKSGTGASEKSSKGKKGKGSTSAPVSS